MWFQERQIENGYDGYGHFIRMLDERPIKQLSMENDMRPENQRNNGPVNAHLRSAIYTQ